MEGKWLLKGMDKLKVRKKSSAPRSFVSSSTEDNRKRVARYKKMYDALRPYREQRKRCYDFVKGKHWEDKVLDPNNVCGNSYITERELLMREGRQPLSNNLILKDVNFVIGLFRDGHKKPMAVATNVMNQDYSDMMSNAMYYVYNENEGLNIDADGLLEMLAGGLVVSGVRPKWKSELRRTTVEIANENPAMLFFDGDISDIRMSKINTIGFLRAYTKSSLLENFANSAEERKWLIGLYDRYVNLVDPEGDDPFAEDKYDNEDFYTPYRRDMFRVIEAWELEDREMMRVHDKLEGKVYVLGLERKADIEKLNTARAEQLIQEGISEDELDDYMIVPEYFIEKYWVVRYLTPYGDELYCSRTPYIHGDTPYTIRCYRIVNGTIQSWVSNLIPQQKYINRYITMMDFKLGASAKGVLIFPEQLRPKNMSHEDIIRTWSKSNGVIFTDMKPGTPLPQQYNTNAITSGELEMLNSQQGLLEEISGVRGAATGQTASQGTPSSLYAQESQNAIVNLRDVTDFFVSYLRARNLKMMKLILQYFTDKTTLVTFNPELPQESMVYDPDKIRGVLFDLVPTESSINVPSFTMYQNDILKELALGGVITPDIWLKRSSFPYQAGLIRDIDEMKRQQAAAMQQQQSIDAGKMEEPEQGLDAMQGEPIGGDTGINQAGEMRPSHIVADALKQRENNMNM